MTDTDTAVRDRISGAIRHYLDVLEGKDGATLHDLAKALDGLVVAYHQTTDVGPDGPEVPLPPGVDHRPIDEAASAAFPDLGWYSVVDPQGAEGQRIGQTIATSDLAEIAADLLDVLWQFENARHNDAVWAFRFGYQTHWGRHLHEIRTYLHSLAAW